MRTTNISRKLAVAIRYVNKSYVYSFVYVRMRFFPHRKYKCEGGGSRSLRRQILV
jgi:hypothetical protein